MKNAFRKARQLKPLKPCLRDRTAIMFRLEKPEAALFKQRAGLIGMPTQQILETLVEDFLEKGLTPDMLRHLKNRQAERRLGYIERSRSQNRDPGYRLLTLPVVPVVRDTEEQPAPGV